jgi:hypothetical protein
MYPWHRAADDLVEEHDARAALAGLEGQVADAELAAPAGLLLQLPLDVLRAALDRLQVRDLGRLQLDLHVVQPRDLLERHLDVELPQTREQELAGALVALQRQAVVLLDEAMQRLEDLVLLALVLGLDRERDDPARGRLRCAARGVRRRACRRCACP